MFSLYPNTAGPEGGRPPMRRAVLALILAVATPAGAVDLPAPPAMDAPAR